MTEAFQDAAHAIVVPVSCARRRTRPPRTLLAVAFVMTSLAGRADGASAQDPAVYYIAGAAFGAVLPGFVFGLAQPDAGTGFLKASGGYFDAMDDENQALDFMVEYQPGVTWHRIKPLFGLAWNSDGTVYGWASAAHDFHLSPYFVVNVNTGPAFYLGGPRGKNLGSTGVLRSGFEIGLRFPDDLRLTWSFHHMSHGKLLNGDWNPGTEIMAVNLSWPIH